MSFQQILLNYAFILSQYEEKKIYLTLISRGRRSSGEIIWNLSTSMTSYIINDHMQIEWLTLSMHNENVQNNTSRTDIRIRGDDERRALRGRARTYGAIGHVRATVKQRSYEPKYTVSWRKPLNAMQQVFSTRSVRFLAVVARLNGCRCGCGSRAQIRVLSSGPACDAVASS